MIPVKLYLWDSLCYSLAFFLKISEAQVLPSGNG